MKACTSFNTAARSIALELGYAHGWRVFFRKNLSFRLVAKAAGKIESFSLSPSLSPSVAVSSGCGGTRTRIRIYNRVSACYRFRSTLCETVYLCVLLLYTVFTLEACWSPFIPLATLAWPTCAGERESRKKGWISRHVSARATHLTSTIRVHLCSTRFLPSVPATSDGLKTLRIPRDVPAEFATREFDAGETFSSSCLFTDFQRSNLFWKCIVSRIFIEVFGNVVENTHLHSKPSAFT